MSVNLDIHTDRNSDDEDLEIVMSGGKYDHFGTIEFEVKRGHRRLSTITVFIDKGEVNETLVKLTSFQPEIEDHSKGNVNA